MIRTININSKLNSNTREIRYPEFNNVFLLCKLKVEDIEMVRWTILDRQSLRIILTSEFMADAIRNLDEFLLYKNQDDLDEYIYV